MTSRGPGAGQVVRDTWGKGTTEEGGPAGNLKRAHKNIHKSKSHLEASSWSLRISISILAFSHTAAWGWGIRVREYREQMDMACHPTCFQTEAEPNWRNEEA